MLSLPDMLIIGGAALLVFGPKRLPEVAKSLGRGLRDFKKAVEGHDETAEPKAVIDASAPEVVAENNPEKKAAGGSK